MEIVIPPPQFLLWLVLGSDLVVVASVLLKRSLKTAIRIVTLGVVAAASVMLLVFFYRPLRLEVTQQALVDDTYFGRVTTPWAQVRRAYVVEGYGATDWRPTLKVGGNSIPGLKTGWFRLKNGKTARVLIQGSSDALVLEADQTLYLLAPDRLAELVAAVGAHVEIVDTEANP